MKHLFISIGTTLLAIAGLAQTTEDNFKTDHHQLIVQGLSDESIAAQITALNVKTIEIEKSRRLEYAE